MVVADEDVTRIASNNLSRLLELPTGPLLPITSETQPADRQSRRHGARRSSGMTPDLTTRILGQTCGRCGEGAAPSQFAATLNPPLGLGRIEL